MESLRPRPAPSPCRDIETLAKNAHEDGMTVDADPKDMQKAINEIRRARETTATFQRKR